MRGAALPATLATAELTLSDMSALLAHHLHFAHRCANSYAALFFGLVKEQLWVVDDVEYRHL